MKTWTIQNLETNHNGYDWPTFAIRSQPGNHCLAVVGEMDNATAPFNAANADAIEAGEVEALTYSSVEFIEKASGIKARHVMSKAPILDPEIMAPRWDERPDDEISILAEIGVAAARQALERAGRKPEDVDAVLCAASNMQRL